MACTQLHHCIVTIQRSNETRPKMSVAIVLELGKRLHLHKHGSVGFCTHVRWVLTKTMKALRGKEKQISANTKFCCGVLAHKVRPGDIKVVGALGDSITVRQDTRVILLTLSWGSFKNHHVVKSINIVIIEQNVCLQAGFGAKAKNLLELLIESRGVSWRWEIVL